MGCDVVSHFHRVHTVRVATRHLFRGSTTTQRELSEQHRAASKCTNCVSQSATKVLFETMGRKRKRAVPDSQERIFCYYCDRTFQNEHELLSHQREKHLRCPTCNKRMLSVPSLMIHASQMHNVQLKAVPNAISGRDSPHLQVLGMENIPDDYYSRHQKGQGHTQPARSANVKSNHNNNNNSHSHSTNSTNYSNSSVPPLTAVNPHYPPHPHHQQQHVPPQYPHPQYPPAPHPPPSLPGNQTYAYPTAAQHLHHHQAYAAYHHQNSYPHVALMPQPTYQHHPHMNHPTWYPNGHPYYPNAHGASTYHRPLSTSSAPAGGHRAPASGPVSVPPPVPPSSTSSANPTPTAGADAVSSATTTPASVSLPSEPLSTLRQPTDAPVTSKDGNQRNEKSVTAPDKQDGAASDSTIPVQPQRPPDNCTIVFDSIDMSPEENRAKLSRYQLKAAT